MYNRNVAVFMVIMRKNAARVFAKLPSLILDCLSPALGQLVMYGYLFPLLGMPESMVGPLYLGSMLPLFFQLGYSLTMHTGFDLESNRIIDYQITLPLSKRWLFATYIATNMLETALAIIPLLTLGIFLLPTHFSLATIMWGSLIVLFPIILLFFATFFLSIAYCYDFWWIRNNFWPRRMFPLFFISACLVPWYKAYAFWPLLSYCMLLSPLTYVAEGLRATLLGSSFYLPVYVSIPALCLFIGINLVVLTRSIRTKLDPV